jgi:hypothetical protein
MAQVRGRWRAFVNAKMVGNFCLDEYQLLTWTVLRADSYCGTFKFNVRRR